jgi:DNA-binding Xre family transcriptional regulator
METATMIRLKVAEQLKQRGWTAYRLAKEAGLSIPVAYRLADPEGGFSRLDVETLDALCKTFQVQPGDLLEWVPDKKGRKRNA